MANCPINKKSKTWKSLVSQVGENNAYGLWNIYNGNVPQSAINQIVKKETVTTKSSDSISAIKLQELLIKEVSFRPGYPLNMISALELNEDKTDFKIPLWASPYSEKFESLLSSMVNNKVVKQKFPGHSYVLGSEEGFKLKEGDEAAEELKKSGIIFTENFDPKTGLQPMRWDPTTKQILPAQIMIPFKFKDESGQILTLEKFTKRTDDGRILIDFDKIPQKVLQLVGFRIPTQERNSMASVEIVGFLPEASGDLVLAPRDFTKQMGSDFDVDKLYTYMYNTYYKNGKLHTDFLSNKETIEKRIREQKEIINNIKKDLNLSKEDIERFDNAISQILENREQFLEEAKEKGIIAEEENDSLAISEIISRLLKGKSLTREVQENYKNQIKDALDEISLLKRSFVAANQNKIISIHHDILNSKNPEIIKSVLALDSFGEFEPLAKTLYSIKKNKQGPQKVFTILSDKYQRTKYINATAGKNGVGNFSLDSTFNAIVQGKELAFINMSEELKSGLIANNEFNYQNIIANNSPIVGFNDVVSFGDISNEYTLKSQRIIQKAKEEGRELSEKEREQIKTKSSIIRYLQSTAVDNEKAQILDKINVNDETFDAIRALTMLGFEEKDIVMFLNQDIILEYINTIIKRRSSLQGFTANLEENILRELSLKYIKTEEIPIQENFFPFSTEELENNIATKTLSPAIENVPDFNMKQIQILQKFFELSELGKNIKSVQSAINTESKGVPKSIIEIESKKEQINNLVNNTKIINTERLLGEYTATGLETPTTINGFASYYGTLFASKTFQEYFPYNKEGVKSVLSEIELYTENADASNSKKAELHKEIIKGMKSYFFSNSKSNLFTEDSNKERTRLFIDNKNHLSLASILNKLSEETWFKSNAFLNKLDFSINSNGQPSKIFFEASSGENFDERNIYNGFIELISTDKPIGTFNNIEYTTRMLAQELIAAALLEGGNMGSKQYIKYIPIHYLKTVGFGEYLKNISFSAATFKKNVTQDAFADYIQPSVFAKQFIQNNPSAAPSVSLEDINISDKGIPEFFTIKKESIPKYIKSIPSENGVLKTTYQHFVSLYDPKLPNNYALYEYSTAEKGYKRISVLADSYGFSQYNSETDAISINKKEQIKGVVIQENPKLINEPIPEQVTPLSELITNGNKIETGQDFLLNVNLTDPIRRFNDLIFTLTTSEGVSTYITDLLLELSELKLPKSFNIVYLTDDKYAKSSAGNYNTNTQTLTLNLAYFKDKPIHRLAETVAHELVHVHTSKAIKLFQRRELDKLTKEQIDTIESLENLKNQYLEDLVNKEGEDGIIQFHNKYWTWKYNKGDISKETLDIKLKQGLPKIGKKADETILGEIIFTEEERNKYYGGIKLEEFVSMALTDLEFQKRLNEIEAEPSVPWWSKFKDLVIRLLNNLGLDIKENSLLKYAIEDSINLIKINQEESKKNFVKTQVTSPPKIHTTLFNDPNKFTNYSGAALGADAEWENIGKEFGIGQQINYRPQDLQKLSVEHQQKIEEAYQRAVTVLGRRPLAYDWKNPNAKNAEGKSLYYSGGLVRRDYLQAEKADAIFAIVEGFDLVDGVFVPKGGTGYATMMAVEMKKPVFIFSQADNQWYEAKYLSEDEGSYFYGFEQTNIPILTPNFAGIGTRQINEAGKQAIKDVYTKTFAKSPHLQNVKKYELFPGVFANQGQTEALDKIKEFLDSDKKFFLLQGKGGTGKTTIIKKAIEDVKGKRILAIAPSHKAKKVLAASMEDLKVDVNIKTLAAALAIKLDESTGKFSPDEFARKKGNFPIKKAEVIIIDEASMVSDALLEELKEFLPKNAKIIFMGDRAQLPPVGQEKDSAVFNIEDTYELTEKMRQAAGSPILNLGTKIAENAENDVSRVANPISINDRVDMVDPVSKSSLHWVNNTDIAIDQFVEDFKTDPTNTNNAKIITFNNEKHQNPQSVKNLNIKVREKLFGENPAQFEVGEWLTAYDTFARDAGMDSDEIVFYNSDDLIVKDAWLRENFEGYVTANSLKLGARRFNFTYDVVFLELLDDKGERIPTINPIPVIAESSRVKYEEDLARLWKTDKQLAFALKNQFANLQYGYAITSHKAQGSTYKNVYVMEDNIMGPSNGGSVKAKNQSLYVAVSRPTTKLVMISSKNTQQSTKKPLDLGLLSKYATDIENIYDPDTKIEPTIDEWEEYNKLRNQEGIDEMLIFKDAFEEYLKICKL